MSELEATLGRRLKSERERKALTVQRTADDLHLDAWVVDALESEDYARIGPSVYVRGHLKRYAELLGLPAAEVLETYASQVSAPVAAAQPAAMRIPTLSRTGSESPWAQMTGFAVAALVIVGVLWWRPWHARAASAPPPAAAGAAHPASAAETAATPGDSERETPADTVAAAAPPESAPTPTRAVAGHAVPAVAPVRSDAAPVAGVGRARLRLSFSADSWVDVHDAMGQRVFAGNGRANSVKTIAGAAPLRVYLKSASGVQLEINNHAAAIGPQFLAGGVARFEAGADGVLRRDTRAGAADAAANGEPRPRG